MNRFAIVLAAGKGTRMKSTLYKVLHPVCGKPMVEHVVDQVSKVAINEMYTIVGHGAEDVQTYLGDRSQYCLQEEQLGTGHAVQQAKDFLSRKEGTTLVVCGDTPLLTSETLEALLQTHEAAGAAVTVLTTHEEDPTGYGRIVRDDQGHVSRIVEQKDATEDVLRICEVNTGTYCFDNKKLFEALEEIKNNNAQGEYYLPDCIEIMKANGDQVAAYATSNRFETIGVNDRVALSKASLTMKERILTHHMRQGVTVVDPQSTFIEADVEIGSDTVLEPGTTIRKGTIIGSSATIGPNTELVRCSIGNNTTVRQSVVYDSTVGNGVQIGPFAHVRPDSFIENDVKIGNFVEVKKSRLGARSKASHLSYIGDADIGEDVNYSCGAITVNYDGKNKARTIIEDGAFIGCNANLLAPVTIGKEAFVAAGSTITDDVPGKALTIARARQVNKENYAEKLNHKK